MDKLSLPLPLESEMESAVEQATRQLNNAIVFDPEENLMAYTVRDPVGGSVMAKEYNKVRCQSLNMIGVSSADLYMFCVLCVLLWDHTF